ncbi:MAG: serine/threonine protein kinase [Lachnospiraceae bacterium]|nr:serine/threonine protein kinase [Lachnospiraceae bacterium]
MDNTDRQKYPQALPKGAVLCGKYEIQNVLGEGGFGVTYAAVDKQTNETVAIKEYFPETLAAREGKLSIRSYSGERQYDFEYGKERFIEETKTLAEFIGNPGIVRVQSYFEENGTAYFVMEYLEGQTLQQYIDSQGGKLEWKAAWKLLLPVADALSAVHEKGIIHRDVKPGNIFITKDGSVKLIDFGAARYSLGDQTHSLSVVLTYGFAPLEQYKRRGRQGPYTDLYAFAATYYYAITGKTPQDSIERMDDDELIPPGNLGISLPRKTEDALLKALEVRSADRYQSMEEFKGEFEAGAAWEDNWTSVSDTPANPVHHCAKKDGESDYTEWDYVYFGSYPQSEVTDAETIDAIESEIASSDVNGDAGVDVWVGGTKYRRIGKSDTNNDKYFGDSTYRYFKWESIKWKVLSNDGVRLFLVADKGLDCKTYNDTYTFVSWKSCTLRSWLNDYFYDTAFSQEEQSAIAPQPHPGEAHTEYGTNGGNDTMDKVYLLSMEEATKPAYGFHEKNRASESRWVQTSPYASARGASIANNSNTGGNNNCWWWLRSPGDYSGNAASVTYHGSVNRNGTYVYNRAVAVVPALHINLSSDLWSMSDDGTSGSGGE